MQNSHRLSSAPPQTNIEAAQDALFELTYRAVAGRHIEEKHSLFAMELGTSSARGDSIRGRLRADL